MDFRKQKEMFNNTKEIFNKNYVQDNLAICPIDKKSAKELLELANYFGYKWNSGSGYLEKNYWDDFTNNTVYYLKEGKYGTACFTEGYNIISYEKGDFDKLLSNYKKEVSKHIANTNVEWVEDWLKGKFYIEIENLKDRFEVVSIANANNIKTDESCFDELNYCFCVKENSKVLFAERHYIAISTNKPFYTLQELKQGKYKRYCVSATKVTSNQFTSYILTEIKDNKTDVTLNMMGGHNLRAIAKCNPEDEFDREIGFCVAFTRALLGDSYKEVVNKIKNK